MTMPDSISELITKAEARGDRALAAHLRAWLLDVVTGAHARRERESRHAAR